MNHSSLAMHLAEVLVKIIISTCCTDCLALHVYTHLKAAHECKKDAGEEWRPSKLVKEHFHNNCYVGLGILCENIPVQCRIPQMTCGTNASQGCQHHSSMILHLQHLQDCKLLCPA